MVSQAMVGMMRFTCRDWAMHQSKRYWSVLLYVVNVYKHTTYTRKKERKTGRPYGLFETVATYMYI